jgi:hypothetical protein
VRIAGRRLADAEPAGRSGHAAGLVQRGREPQQVQVGCPSMASAPAPLPR